MFEPADTIAVRNKIVRQQPQRDAAMENRVLREKHLAHPALAEF